MQVIATEARLPVARVDLESLPSAQREREVRRLARREVLRPFDLATGPLLRFTLLRLAEREHVALLSMHHIVSDGWSLGVLLQEVMALYLAFGRGEASPLPQLEIQYADFAHWQRSWLRGEVLEQEVAHWRKILEGNLDALELPLDRPRPPAPDFSGGRHLFALEDDLGAELRALGQQRSSTSFMTLLAAFTLLLSRYSGRPDIRLGTPIAGRRHVETEGLIGFFVNMLVLRLDLEETMTFEDLLDRVREVTLEAQNHQDLPFEKLVEELQPERSLSQTPLFQVSFTHQTRGSDEGQELEGLRLEMLELDTDPPELYDLTLSMEETENRLLGTLGYQTALFDGVTIQRMVGHLRAILRAVAQDPREQLAELSFLGAGERHQVCVEWSGVSTDFPRQSTLAELFATWAERIPDSVAVVQGQETLTYGGLAARSGVLAQHLRRLGVGPEVLVGIAARRTPRYIEGIVGILAAGGAYVPLDLDYPAERLSAMVKEAPLELLLTYGETPSDLPDLGCEVLNLETLEQEAEHGPLPTGGSSPLGLAYVMFTSGSTGRPKGVAVVHRGVVRLAQQTNYAVFGPWESTLLLAPLSFDASTAEIWCLLSNGGRVVMDSPGPASLEETGALVERSRITTLWLTAGLFHQVVDGPAERFAGVRQLLAGGDVLAPSKVAKALERLPETRLSNCYGPTENTTFTSCHPVLIGDPASTVPIGRAVANSHVRVLDRALRPVPSGVLGELHAGGDGLARGYLGNPSATAERFVPDPLAATPGARLYRTGDLVKLRSDGVLKFFGRFDHQIKIRGFRIELAEIERNLVEHPEVAAAVVLRQGEATDTAARLVAHVVPGNREQRSVAGLREHLASRLPEPMVPSLFQFLEALPLDPNDKVDRKALALRTDASEDRAAAAAPTAPRTPTEELLAGIWAEVLEFETVGVEANFFDLGGHSLLATKIISRIHQTFGVEIPLRSLFETPTVAGMAPAIDQALRTEQGSTAPPLVPVAYPEAGPPLSLAQQRLWFVEQLEPGTTAYNMPLPLRIQGELDPRALEAALGAVIERHESLRTTFSSTEGEPVQVIAPPPVVHLPRVDLDDLPEAKRLEETRRLALLEAARPFDLITGPLVRFTLLRLAEDEHVVLLTMHHIISDGWSMNVLMREVIALYGAFRDGQPSPLPELPIQYADYATWQRQWLQGEVLEQQVEWWRRRLGTGSEVLDLPTDRPRPSTPNLEGGAQAFPLGNESTQALVALGRRHGATPFMTLLAVYQWVLARHAGASQVRVGTPVAGRNRVETEGLIGFFVNMLVLRMDFEATESFEELLTRVREVILETYTHQDLPFEKLVEELRPERSLARNPLVQVLFTVQDPGTAQDDTSDVGFGLEVLDTGEVPPAIFDMTLTLDQGASGMVATWGYKAALYDPSTVQRLVGHFQSVLRDAVEDPTRPLADLRMLTSGERHQLLREWNEHGLVGTQDASREQDELLHQQIASWAREQPDTPALVFENHRLSYGELNRRATQLASYLAAHGVGPEVLVGISLDRSPEMFIALLAILKAGGAYLPLDPAYPPARVAYMIEDSGVRRVLSQESLRQGFPEGLQVLCLDSQWPEVEAAGAGEAASTPSAEAHNLAYVIYTSGSTGRPKGVLISHQGLPNISRSLAHWLEVGVGSRVLQFSSLNFDASILEVLMGLSVGGTLVSAGRETLMPGPALADWLRREAITCTILPPSALAVLPPGDFPALSTLTVGGEACSADVVSRWAPGRRFFNFYGPTEATIWVSVAQCIPSGAPPTIGRPIFETDIHLLDRSLAPVPMGGAGQLLIASPNLSRGYLGQPRKTASSFLPNPFGEGVGERLYATGDLARYRPDGEIEFLGRVDQQVKVRGFRIETGEVEAALLTHPAVREAVVVQRRASTGGAPLVAHVVPEADATGDDTLTVEALRAHLRESLPEPMVPAHFRLREQLPMTPNLKVDRRALAAESLAEVERAAEGTSLAPRNPLEQSLAKIWAELLEVDEVGVRDSFFDLGGHSLLAVRLMARIEQETGLDLPLSTLFQEPTVEGLAALVRRRETADGGASLVPIQPKGTRPPLFAVHPIGGGVFCYEALASILGEDRPLYGLQSQGLSGDEAPFTRMEDMAGYYISEMETVDPAGPYHLIGWSMGGLLVFEMARQLRARGREVALLALFDAQIPSEYDKVVADHQMSLLYSFALDFGLPLASLDLPWDVLLQWDESRQLQCILETAQEAEAIPREIGLRQVERLFRVFKFNARAIAHYVPGDYDGSMLFLKAEEELSQEVQMGGGEEPTSRLGKLKSLMEKSKAKLESWVAHPARGWQRLAKGGVKAHTVPGNHMTILARPQVETLAELLQSELDQIENSSEGRISDSAADREME